MEQLKLTGHSQRHGLEELLRLFYGPAGSPFPVQSSLVTTSDLARVRTEAAGQVLERQVAADFAKREIKRQLYQVLALVTGLNFPWGSLTGIRPTVVAAEFLRENPEPAWAVDQLVETYQLAVDKARLAVQTAQAEMRVLGSLPQNSPLVYLSVPFCPTRCSYCSFISQAAAGRSDLFGPYVKAVLKEASLVFGQLDQPVQAFYLGGGTPTCLPPKFLQELLEGVFTRLPLMTGAEVTVEAGRPDTLSPAVLDILGAFPVTRLCINPQTFHDKTLKKIGRQHTVSQMHEAWQLARSMGFENLNLDLIAGLPGETPSDLAFSLEEALKLNPAGLTLHSLALKRGSRLQETGPGQEQLLPKPKWQEATGQARQALADRGLFPYYLYKQKYALGGLENTGFARPGRECVYNVAMMSDAVPVIGLGSFAVSKQVTSQGTLRQTNPRDLKTYLERVDELAEKKLAWFSQPAR